MRILEDRNRIDFHALYAGKVSLETYSLCEPELKQASVLPRYTCPPHLRGQSFEFFKQRLDEIY